MEYLKRLLTGAPPAREREARERELDQLKADIRRCVQTVQAGADILRNR